jgi:hypothetical protein
MGVATGPGARLLTRTLAFASSTASERVIDSTAPLVALYSVEPAKPLNARTLVLLTMAPPPLFTRAGTSARSASQMPRTLVSKTAS